MERDTSNIKAAIIMLDGCVLDLNRYRYNYYKHLCEDHHISVTKEEFYNQLGNMKTMYDNLPLNNLYKTKQFNNRIEEQLYDYLSHSDVYTKEGLFELLDYFHQKDIKVAIISTHSTKNAINYLKMTRVYSHVDYIIGSDTKIKPLPSNDMIKAISIQFECQFNEMIVVSPMLALNKVAYDLKCHVYYFEDLIEAREAEIQTSHKTISSFFEILNHLLFHHIYDDGMYSSILGMNNIKDKEELDDINHHLKDVYHNDPEILNIIENTYQYNLSFINGEKKLEKDTEDKVIDTDSKETSTSDEEIEVKVEEETTNDEKNTSKKETKEYTTVKEEALSLNKQETIELTSAWDKLMSNEKEEVKEPEEKKEKVKYNKFELFLYIFTEFIYSFVFSFLVLFIGIMIAIIYKNYISTFPYLYNIFQIYQILIDNIVKVININFVSPLALELLIIFIFNSLIIFVIKIIYFMFNKQKLLEE